MRKKSVRLLKSLYKQDEYVEIDDYRDVDLTDEGSTLTWSNDETLQLIANIKKQLKKRDTYSYVRRIQLLNWNKIKIEGKTEIDCKSRLQYLIKSIRHVRTLDEILSDVDTERIDARKPKSAYALFCDDMKKDDLNGNNFFKEASTRFHMLSDVEKASYELKSQQQSKVYKELYPKGMERKKTRITTPLMLFVKDRQNKGQTDKDKLRKQFAALEDTEKLTWVQLALGANEDNDIEKLLTKDEPKILQDEPKQPLNAFNLFIKEKAAEIKMDFKEAGEAYRKLSKEEKDVYIETARKAKIQYKDDLAKYLFSLSPNAQRDYLNKMENQNLKRRKTTKKIENVNINWNDDAEDIGDECERIEQGHQNKLVEQYNQNEQFKTFEYIRKLENGQSDDVDNKFKKTETVKREPASHSFVINQTIEAKQECSKAIDENAETTVPKSTDENVQSSTRDSDNENGQIDDVDNKFKKTKTVKREPTCHSFVINQAIESKQECSKAIYENPETTVTKSTAENLQSNIMDSNNEKKSQLLESFKVDSSKKRKNDDIADDAFASSISQKQKVINTKRRRREDSDERSLIYL